MLRVGSLARSVAFYTEVMGMQLIRRAENVKYEYTVAFLGYGRNPDHAEIELTENYGVTQYDLGNAFGHIAIGVSDIYAVCEAIKAAGGVVSREPGLVRGGRSTIAFVVDPDGYKIELIQRP